MGGHATCSAQVGAQGGAGAVAAAVAVAAAASNDAVNLQLVTVTTAMVCMIKRSIHACIFMGIL